MEFRSNFSRSAFLALATLAASMLGQVWAEEPLAALSQSLEAEVIKPFRDQLEELERKGVAHAEAIDSGKAHEVTAPEFAVEASGRPSPDRNLDFAPGWVMRVVRPFEHDYYTTKKTRYEIVGWQWVEGVPEGQATIRYRESLLLKNADSLAEIAKAEWQSWLSVDHYLTATRRAGQWAVEEAAAPTPTPGGSRSRAFYDVSLTPTPAAASPAP